MSTDRLRERLSDLAGEVALVDLRDRAVRTSRRRSVRRAVAASVAVLAVTGGSAVIVTQLSGRSLPPAPSSSPSPSAVPAPTVTGVPAPTTIGGTLYYARSGAVHALRQGADQVVATYGNDACAGNSVVVSPDGRWITWVGGGSTAGQLRVAGTAPGSTVRTVLTDVVCLGSNAIAWIGSTTIAVTRLANGRHQAVHVDAEAGKSSPATDTPWSQVWSVDTSFVATRTSTGGRVSPFNSVTGTAHDFTYTPPAAEASHHDGWDIRSVSIDGRYVALCWLGTDPGRKLETIAVVNVVDSTVVKLPVASFRSVHFLGDGHVLVQTDASVVLLDAAFRELDRRDVPPYLALLRYVS